MKLPQEYCLSLFTNFGDDVDKIASNAWLKAGELFPETTGFMIVIQDNVISTSNYKKHILMDPSTIKDTAENSERN
jgi:hypothetical protein